MSDSDTKVIMPATLAEALEDDLSSLDDWDWLERFKARKADAVPLIKKLQSETSGLISPIVEESSAE